jgi:hypothetical protein
MQILFAAFASEGNCRKSRQLAFSLGGVSFGHTRNFSKISVNKTNNLRKSDRPGIFRKAKNIFSKKNTMQWAPKTEHHFLLADPPEIGISKISEDDNKKRKVFGGFFGKCLRMQMPQIKFVKFCH